MVNYVKDCNTTAIMVIHSDYHTSDSIPLITTRRTPVLFDGRHVLDASQPQAVGLTYRMVGKGEKTA